MALVADEEDVETLLVKTLDLIVHLGHQRAGGVNGLQVLGCCLLLDGGADTVGGEHHVGTLGSLGGLIDEDNTLVGEGVHHITVVHNLLAHIDRGTVFLECTFHGFHRAVNTGAVAAWGGKQDLLTGFRAGAGYR